MPLNTYNKIRLVIAIIVAIIVSQSIIFENFFVPVITVITSSLVLLYCRRQVKTIIADERDYLTSGKSAFLAVQIYSWIAVIAMFVFYAYRGLNPMYEAIGMTLAFSTCLLMILYSVIFRFYDKITFSKNSLLYFILVGILAALLSVFTIRLFSGEDNWVCEKGQWIQHGKPDFAAPTTLCK